MCNLCNLNAGGYLYCCVKKKKKKKITNEEILSFNWFIMVHSNPLVNLCSTLLVFLNNGWV